MGSLIVAEPSQSDVRDKGVGVVANLDFSGKNGNDSDSSLGMRHVSTLLLDFMVIAVTIRSKVFI